MVFMVYLASTDLHMTVAVIYGLALIALFSVSTAFHVISYTGWLRYYITSASVFVLFCLLSINFDVS